jgi:hypothetical protein
MITRHAAHRQRARAEDALAAPPPPRILRRPLRMRRRDRGALPPLPEAPEEDVEDRSLEFLKRLLDTPAPERLRGRRRARLARGGGEFADRVDADVSGNSIAISTPGGARRASCSPATSTRSASWSRTSTTTASSTSRGSAAGTRRCWSGQRIRLLTRTRRRARRDRQEADPPDEGRREGQGLQDRGPVDRHRREGPRRRHRPRRPRRRPRRHRRRLSSSATASSPAAPSTTASAPSSCSRRCACSRRPAEGRHGRRRRDHAGGDRLLRRRRRPHQRVHLDPHVAIVVDVTFASDAPGIEKKESASTSSAADRSSRAARPPTRGWSTGWSRRPRRRDPVHLIAAPRYTSTDADAIYLSAAGVATASSPCRTGTCTRRTRSSASPTSRRPPA